MTPEWFRKLLEIDERIQAGDYYRASGIVKCRVCGRVLDRHPELYDYTKESPEYVGLTLLCNGDLIHL